MTKPPENSVHPKSRAEWRDWLQKNHTRTEGIWFISFKKATGLPRVDYDESVEEALCFGWVDSKPAKLDAERSMLWFAPRNAKTGWSAPNKARVKKMIAAKQMHPSGIAKVDAAKADGTWSMLDGVEQLEIPDDLKEAFARYPESQTNFEAFPRSAKRGILEWIHQAKKPETRAKRIDETARLAGQNVRANQWTPGARDSGARGESDRDSGTGKRGT